VESAEEITSYGSARIVFLFTTGLSVSEYHIESLNSTLIRSEE